MQKVQEVSTRARLSFLGIVSHFPEKFSLSSKGRPFNFFDDLLQNGLKISKRPSWRANWVQRLGFSGAVEENN